MKKQRGFTLIELAIVLLVIGILAGLMLRNVGIYSIQARDSKRKGDLRNLSVNLVQYNASRGFYPSAATLVTDLQSIGVANLPNTPRVGEWYEYWACSDNPSSGNNHFILKATLEQTSSANPALYADSYNSSTPPTGWTCSGVRFNGNSTSSLTGSPNCSASQNYYCVAQ